MTGETEAAEGSEGAGPSEVGMAGMERLMTHLNGYFAVAMLGRTNGRPRSGWPG
jgi:hypothetical protein